MQKKHYLIIIGVCVLIIFALIGTLIATLTGNIHNIFQGGTTQNIVNNSSSNNVSNNTNNQVNNNNNSNNGNSNNTTPHYHTYGSWVTVKEPTCTEEGLQEQICSCGEKLSSTGLKILNHAESDWIIDLQPTKTEKGAKHIECTMCRKTMKEEAIPAIGSIGLAYTVNDNGKSCAITGIGSCTDTHVIVPEMIDGYAVVEIATRAFYDCKGIKEITIPASVTSIGTQIFYKADNLHTVYYNSTYSSSQNPFLNPTNIKKVVLGGKEMPYSLVENLPNIEEVELKSPITKIREYAFSECTALKSVTIPDSVTHIEKYAFENCTSLVNLTIPHSVTRIDDRAFFGCTSLTSITIPDSVINIGDRIFEECASLKQVALHDSITSISDYMFYNCSSLESVTIPDSVTSIGDYAFYHCTSLKRLTIPESVTTIENSVFRECSSLVSMTFPGSVKSIGSNVFRSCNSLINVTIPISVTSIGDVPFVFCPSLEHVYYQGTISQFHSLFHWNTSLLASLDSYYTVHCSDGDEIIKY